MEDPLLRVRQAKVDLQREKFEWAKQKHQQENADRERARERAIDLEYLKITVLVILLIIVIWYLTCKFGFLRGMGSPDAPNSNRATEHFSPYASILTPDTYRTDSSFDYANNMPYKDLNWSERMNVDFNHNAQRIASEDKLADQLLDLVM